MREFEIAGRRIRVAVHHDGSPRELEAFVADVAEIVRVQGALFRQYPDFEPGHYTFIADYLPHAAGDGMEHRNSTVLTSSGSLRTRRLALLNTVAHEFFHVWNVERIRPASLEPFDFERAHLSGELWLAEGFTSYYAALTLRRAGLTGLEELLPQLHGFIGSMLHHPARRLRSAEEMSHMAAFTDGAQPTDRTNWTSTVISYYSFGGAIALALDLSLRERSRGEVTLDDYMRALWRAHGSSGGSRPGYVDRPYTMADAEAALAAISDETFARNFFSRYIRGHEAADYPRLLSLAGLVLRHAQPGRAWLGDVGYEHAPAGVRVASPPLMGTPLHEAGITLGDELRQLGGSGVRSPADIEQALSRRSPGDRIEVVFVDRTGRRRTTTVTAAQDPALELVPMEQIGRGPTPAQRAFRDQWLN
jgi:predicted metalloprotease with PDZ domain